MESKSARNARLKAMRRKYGLGEFKNKSSRRVVRVARRRSGRKGGSRGGFGVKGLLSQNNIIGTLAGAWLGPKFGVSSNIGAAAGSYLIGKKGLLGAGVGYFAGPIVVSKVAPMVGMSGSSSSWGQ